MGTSRRRGLRSRRRRRHCLVRCLRGSSDFTAFVALVLAAPAMTGLPAGPAMAAAPPEGRQIYYPECEAAVNIQICLQLYSSYMYLSMASYYERFHADLSHFSAFFRRRSQLWKEGAERLMWMQNERGGCIVLNNMKEPDEEVWRGCAHVVEYAFRLEDTLRKSLQLLHSLAVEKNDSDLRTFVLHGFLNPQVPALKELNEYMMHFAELETLREGLENYLLRSLNVNNDDNDDGDGDDKEN